jgi:hypothetical protein
VRYRRIDGQFADLALDRVPVEDIVAGLPVREFRSYQGRQHYSGWYWSSTVSRMVVHESQLELGPFATCPAGSIPAPRANNISQPATPHRNGGQILS